MSTERRYFERKQPEDLSYIQFESEGGGIVLNASEAGLAFHAVAVPEPPGPVALCISPNPQMRISLTAEIVWMDETKKSGGIRYTNLTPDTKKQVLAWLTRNYESDGPQKRALLPFEKMMDAEHLHQNVPDENAGLFPSAMLSQEPVRQSRMGKGIATVLFICLLILTSISFIQIFRPEIGNSFIRLGLKRKGNNDLHLQAETSNPTGVAGHIPSLSVPTPRDSPTEMAKEQSSGPTRANPEATTAVSPQLMNPEHVPQHFQSVSPRNSRGESPQQLWSAIAKGDVTAEVALAQLYLTGKGVPKNCEQARVLLKAASKRGNTEAVQQLRQLKKSRCR